MSSALGTQISPIFVLSEESNFSSDRSTREQKVTNCRCSASGSRVQRRSSVRREHHFAAVPATGAGFEHARDCIELNEGHPHVEIANCHSQDDLSRNIHVRRTLLHSPSKGVERRSLRWLPELPGAEVANCPAPGRPHRPSSKQAGKIAHHRFLAFRRRRRKD